MNLSSYSRDRRAIEYWSDGNYVAADRLMGLVKNWDSVSCPKCGRFACSADHIGPISLGFSHRPEFDVECPACNSAAGNRMRLVDVQHLMNVEKAGEQVISWFCRPLWECRKGDVKDDETALRLGKLLNEQLNNAMLVLHRIAENGRYVFLISYLHLDYCEYTVRFENLRCENGKTCYDRLVWTPRDNRYVAERKARRIWVAFDTLYEFAAKNNRSAYRATDVRVWNGTDVVSDILRSAPAEILDLDTALHNLISRDRIMADHPLRVLTTKLPVSSLEPGCFAEARALLEEVMLKIAVEVSSLWDSPKFARAVDSAI